MDRPLLPRRIPGSTQVGEKFSFSRTFTDADVSLFIGATWDVNPYHTDDSFASKTRFGRRIVPGLLTASLLTHLGGLWNFLATEMGFHFLAPVFIGDTVTATCEIADTNEERGSVLLTCQITNDRGEVVLRATINGFPGRFE